jgi:hypothetical protein
MDTEPAVHSHSHSFGHRGIDLALALSALALSIASIIIAIQNESAMKRLVTANSWPYLQMSHGNLRDDGQPVVYFDVRNAGVGPALLEKLVVTYKGQPVRTPEELLARCCNGKRKKSLQGDVQANLQAYVQAVSHYVLSPREDVPFLQVTQSGSDPATWSRLDAERFNVDLQACYSSVFDEHWITSLGNPNSVRVKSCRELGGPAYGENPYRPH